MTNLETSSQEKLTSPHTLLKVLQQLLHDVVREGNHRFEKWRSLITRAPFTPSALNFFTPEDADRITPGMNVEVTPNLLTERRFGGTRERFGGIIGTITHVSQGTMTPDEVTSVVGNSDLAQALITNPVPYSAPDPGAAENLPVVQVEVKLERNPNNVTGYEWVRGKEPNHPIPEGAIGEARVTIESRSPVNYLEPLLRWITGIYSQ